MMIVARYVGNAGARPTDHSGYSLSSLSREQSGDGFERFALSVDAKQEFRHTCGSHEGSAYSPLHEMMRYDDLWCGFTAIAHHLRRTRHRMLRTLLNGKIHRATVTGADLHYIGSITLDPVLMEAANILPFERVQVVDITNGNRFETYAIEGERGGGVVQLNGAAAHLVHVGDLVIVMSYVQLEDPVPPDWQPHVVLVDEHNHIVGKGHMPPTGGVAIDVDAVLP